MSLPKALVTVLLKNPEVTTKEGEAIVPDPKSLEWSIIRLIEDPNECEHVQTCCSSCTNTWAIDYYVRIWSLEHCDPEDPDLGS
jgi:hypothetical protein